MESRNFTMWPVGFSLVVISSRELEHGCLSANPHSASSKLCDLRRVAEALRAAFSLSEKWG